MKKLFLMVLIAFLLFGCAASNKMNNLKLGMTKDDVIQAMGTPSSTSETERVLYLKYRLSTDDYYIRLIDGKVDAYGRFGEFGLGC